MNDAFVQRFSPNADPVGRYIDVGPVAQIIGVVGNVQQRMTFGSFGPVAARPAAYVPASQGTDGGFALVHTFFEPSWIVRADGAPRRVVPLMERALRDVDPALLFHEFRTIDDVRGEATIASRLQAALLTALASMAVGLCMLGVYGLVSQSYRERRRELSLRTALGATPAQIFKAATGSVVVLAAAGAAVGIVIAAAAARAMQTLVFGVSIRDPFTFVGAALLVVLMACAAAAIPALRVLKVDVFTSLNSR